MFNDLLLRIQSDVRSSNPSGRMTWDVLGKRFEDFPPRHTRTHPTPPRTSWVDSGKRRGRRFRSFPPVTGTDVVSCFGKPVTKAPPPPLPHWCGDYRVFSKAFSVGPKCYSTESNSCCPCQRCLGFWRWNVSRRLPEVTQVIRHDTGGRKVSHQSHIPATRSNLLLEMQPNFLKDAAHSSTLCLRREVGVCNRY